MRDSTCEREAGYAGCKIDKCCNKTEYLKLILYRDQEFKKVQPGIFTREYIDSKLQSGDNNGH